VAVGEDVAALEVFEVVVVLLGGDVADVEGLAHGVAPLRRRHYPPGGFWGKVRSRKGLGVDLSKSKPKPFGLNAKTRFGPGLFCSLI
jgi:hypothetical protein